jgi:hypothetical protein
MTTSCKRCGRTLTAARSVAMGYGPTCGRKMADAASRLSALYSPSQLAKALAAIGDGAVIRVARRTFHAVASKGDAVYRVALTAGTCTCRAGEHGLRCYHLAASQILAAA